MRTLRTVGLAVCLSALCVVVTSGDRPASAVSATVAPALDMRGFWEHDVCQVTERDGVRTGSRSLFAIFEREWGIAFTQFADAECATPVMTAVLRGTYEQTRASTRVPHAAEATFRFTYKGLVAHEAALLAK